MAVEKINPSTLSEPEGFMHVGVATGSKMVYLAGQVASNTDGELVGEGNLAAQAEQALLNVAAGLEAGGATFDDVAKVTIYVVDWEEAKMEQLMAGVMAAAQKLEAAPLAPTTLVPVPALFAAGYLIELDVTAVID